MIVNMDECGIDIFAKVDTTVFLPEVRVNSCELHGVAVERLDAARAQDVAGFRIYLDDTVR
jgi:hypothetical protein